MPSIQPSSTLPKLQEPLSWAGQSEAYFAATLTVLQGAMGHGLVRIPLAKHGNHTGAAGEVLLLYRDQSQLMRQRVSSPPVSSCHLTHFLSFSQSHVFNGNNNIAGHQLCLFTFLHLVGSPTLICSSVPSLSTAYKTQSSLHPFFAVVAHEPTKRKYRSTEARNRAPIQPAHSKQPSIYTSRTASLKSTVSSYFPELVDAGLHP